MTERLRRLYMTAEEETAAALHLEESLENGTQVAVKVDCCQYRCCGAGWSDRDSEETYTGRVLSINVDEVLIQVSNILGGKMAEVIVGFDHLVAVTPLVD